MKKLLILCALLFLTACTTSQTELQDNNNKDNKMNTITFLKSLNYSDGLEVTKKIFEYFPMQYATTKGLDGSPQIRPLEYKFEEDGVLYFDTVDFYTSYKEMKEFPYIQICIGDQETMSYLRLGGKVNFTTDQKIIDKCFEASPVLTSQFGNNREHVIAYYLTDVWAELATFHEDLSNHTYELKNKYDVE